MKILTCSLIIIATLISCKNNKRSNIETLNVAQKPQVINSNQTKNVLANNKTDIASSIMGVWGIDNTQNASFKISNETFYYVDENVNYPYLIKGDSVVIKFEDGQESFAVNFRGKDTLIMKGVDGIQTYLRRK